MSDSNATELLRKLLDERGVKYIKDSEYVTTVLMDDKMIRYYGYDGDFSVEVLFPRARLNGTTWFTPEQAIAATLGNPTCEYVIEDNMNESEGMGDVWFRCTNCDTCYDYIADDWLLKMPYCPKCGATVKGVR